MGTLRIFEIGERYGRLEVIERRDTGSQRKILCRCECGTETWVALSNIVNGNTKSCGCYRRERTSEEKKTHGKTLTPTYVSWSHMIQRCTDPNHKYYSNYGGRGITIDPRWLTFENFYEDMGERPQGTSLDRENNDLGYFKDNCRWATRTEQANNRRPRRDYAAKH